MPKEKKVEFKAKEQGNFIEIDGEKYILEREAFKKIHGVEHEDKLVFRKYNKEEHEELLKKVIDALAKKTTKKEIITHILKSLDIKTLRRLVRRIDAKKPIIKDKGCLGFKIGDAYIQLVD